MARMSSQCLLLQQVNQVLIVSHIHVSHNSQNGRRSSTASIIYPFVLILYEMKREEGARVDYATFHKSFSHLEFPVTTIKDFTEWTQFSEIRKIQDKRALSCLIVGIMSHGFRGVISSFSAARDHRKDWQQLKLQASQIWFPWKTLDHPQVHSVVQPSIPYHVTLGRQLHLKHLHSSPNRLRKATSHRSNYDQGISHSSSPQWVVTLLTRTGSFHYLWGTCKHSLNMTVLKLHSRRLSIPEDLSRWVPGQTALLMQTIRKKLALRRTFKYLEKPMLRHLDAWWTDAFVEHPDIW